MIKIKIGKNYYRGVYRWDDITLSAFCKLASIPMPEGYEKYIVADGMDDESFLEVILSLSDNQIQESFPAYYRQVIKCLSNIPQHKIDILPAEEVNYLYEFYFKPFVLSLVYNAPVEYFAGQIKPYEPMSFPSFWIGWNKFYVPKTVNILGHEFALYEEPIITYSEAFDIFKGMKIAREDAERLALFMAIYCRKKGEKYNQKKAIERQGVFMKAPMSVVWMVFFCIVRQLPDSSMITQLFGSLPNRMEKTVQRMKDLKDSAVVV
jgi:hypothetical protein